MKQKKKSKSPSMANKLIHLAHIFIPKKGKTLVYLRQCGDHEYRWYIEDHDSIEHPTDIEGETPEEAMRNAHQSWKLNAFTTLCCGFRYALPERDEHGMNALFHQMTASLSTMNGIYFDEELGHNCFVQNSSQESISLWHKLKNENRL